MSAGRSAVGLREALRAHGAAEQEWLEARAALDAQRRRVASAEAEVAGRLRLAETIRRCRGVDPHAAVALSGARAHAARAAEEGARLASAEAVHARLRRVADERLADVATCLRASTTAGVERRCG